MSVPAVMDRGQTAAPVPGAQGPPLVVPLKQALDSRLVGGKASNLSRLIRLGIPVPSGCVLTCEAFSRFLAGDGLGAEIEALHHRLDPMDLTQREDVSRAIRAHVTAGSLPAQVAGALDTVVRELPSDARLAVRSSAVGEDGVTASFAGQFDSVLHVTTTEALRRAVLACWASYWSERSLYYRAALHAGLGGMAVVVQRQVAARVSGVLFTRAPAGIHAASEDDLVIEWCPGLADGLVSGQVDPERLVVSRDDRTSTPSALSTGDLLAAADLRTLTDVALRLERELGAPQDIEWSIDGERQLWILQTRPITTAPAAPRDADGAVLWSNANVNENFPTPISPLLYSFAAPGYYHYFRNLGLAFGISRRRLAAMDRSLGAIIGVHGARMYYNLTSIHAVLRMAPCGDRLTQAFNQFVGADQVASPPAGAAQWGGDGSRVAQLVELLRVVARTTWQYLFLRRRLEAFEDRADRFAAHTRPDQLADRPLDELLENLRSFLDIRFHRWKDASLADAGAMVCYALLQRSLRTVDTRGGLHNRLLRALPGVPSTVPPRRLWELSRLIREDGELWALFERTDATAILDALRHDERFVPFRHEFDRFLEDWGFRSSAELMLTVPSLQEEPAPVISLLKQYAASDGEPLESMMARQAAERVAETTQVIKALARRSPAKALAVWVLLRSTQASVAYRERARLKQALLYTRLRRVALALGRRLTDAGHLTTPDDIFMLTWQEIDELGSGRAMFPYRVPELISLRRREHATLSAMELPATVSIPMGAYLPLESPLGRRGPVERPCGASSSLSPLSQLSGTGASGGIATGPAAVLGDVRDAERLCRGDVLVTRQTDPGWAPVFGLVSGLVIERGGLLSHGAIVAREFGLPCVVGVENATSLIAPGRHVTVDGDRGVCTIERKTVDSAEAPAGRRGAA